jgi:hypothetical protein
MNEEAGELQDAAISTRTVQAPYTELSFKTLQVSEVT